MLVFRGVSQRRFRNSIWENGILHSLLLFSHHPYLSVLKQSRAIWIANAFDKSIEECVAVICRDECWAPFSLQGLLLISMEYLNVNEMVKPLKGCYVAMVSEMPPSQVRNCRHNLSIVQEKIDKVPCTGTGHVFLCNWRCELYYQIL